MRQLLTSQFVRAGAAAHHSMRHSGRFVLRTTLATSSLYMLDNAARHSTNSALVRNGELNFKPSTTFLALARDMLDLAMCLEDVASSVRLSAASTGRDRAIADESGKSRTEICEEQIS